MQAITIYVDGGTAGGGHPCGAAAVAQNKQGHFLGWESRQLPEITNNEAEYEAAKLGLVLAKKLGATRVLIVSDSETVVRQMQGRSRVNSNRLKIKHQELVNLTHKFSVDVVFRHVPRAKNRLADALASNAIEGQTVTTPVKSYRNRLRQIPYLGKGG